MKRYLLCEQCGQQQDLDAVRDDDNFNQGNGCALCKDKPSDSYAKQADDKAIAIFIQRAMRHRFGKLEDLADEIKYLELV